MPLSKSDGAANGVDTEYHASLLSERGRNAQHVPMKYFAPMKDMMKSLWSPDNEDGNIILAIAENRLSCDMLGERLEAMKGTPIPADCYGYNPPRGAPRLQAAMTAYINRTFMKGAHANPADVSILAGCGCILDTLLFTLADAGTCMAIPAPYYPAFDIDLKVRCGIKPLPLHLAPHASLSAQLDAAAQRAAESGTRMAGVLLTNPNNPTGEVIPAPVLREYLAWCCANGMHLISDEIYANSVFKRGSAFTSMATLLAQSPPEVQRKGAALVHTVFGLSKDWGMSGMRIGCLHTRNREVNASLDNLGYFAMPSTLMQEAAAQLLADEPFVDRYLAENARRLDASYTALTGALEEAGIPFTPAVGAIFLWADFRSFLEEATWEAETKLWQSIVDAGVLLTPGKDCHAAEPGYFRMCYAAAPVEGALAGVARIRSVLKR